jgi:hypothetical protein
MSPKHSLAGDQPQDERDDADARLRSAPGESIPLLQQPVQQHNQRSSEASEGVSGSSHHGPYRRLGVGVLRARDLRLRLNRGALRVLMSLRYSIGQQLGVAAAHVRVPGRVHDERRRPDAR